MYKRFTELKKLIKPNAAAAAIGATTAKDTGEVTDSTAKQGNGMKLTSILKRNKVQVSDIQISATSAQE